MSAWASVSFNRQVYLSDLLQVRGGIPDVKGEFEQLRPAMAHSFPFELDAFQKEAILLLEQVRLQLCLPYHLLPLLASALVGKELMTHS